MKMQVLFDASTLQEAGTEKHSDRLGSWESLFQITRKLSRFPICLLKAVRSSSDSTDHHSTAPITNTERLLPLAPSTGSSSFHVLFLSEQSPSRKTLRHEGEVTHQTDLGRAELGWCLVVSLEPSYTMSPSWGLKLVPTGDLVFPTLLYSLQPPTLFLVWLGTLYFWWQASGK